MQTGGVTTDKQQNQPPERAGGGMNFEANVGRGKLRKEKKSQRGKSTP